MNEDGMLTHRSLTDVRAILTILAKQTSIKPAVLKRQVEDRFLLEAQAATNELQDLS